MRNNKRTARLGKNQPVENSRMIERGRKIRKGNLVRLSRWAQECLPSGLDVQNNVGVVLDPHPTYWDILVLFRADTNRGPRCVLYGFYKADLVLVRR